MHKGSCFRWVRNKKGATLGKSVAQKRKHCALFIFCNWKLSGSVHPIKKVRRMNCARKTHSSEQLLHLSLTIYGKLIKAGIFTNANHRLYLLDKCSNLIIPHFKRKCKRKLEKIYIFFQKQPLNSCTRAVVLDGLGRLKKKPRI